MYWYNCCFYRSDFVIQCGLQTPDGRSVPNPYDDLSVNESQSPANKAVGNKRGTAAVAHWDVPDCGNSEFFINLSDNMHLNDAYGGYCVFAEVADDATWTAIAQLYTLPVRRSGMTFFQEKVAMTVGWA